jgi:type II secretory pathway component PulK
MKKLKNYNRRNSYFNNNGYALIVIIGSISLILLATLYFSFNMKVEARLTENYTESIRAKYIAEAGINRAIAELKYSSEGVVSNFTDTTDEAWASGFTEGDFLDSRGSYEVSIKDAASRININDRYNANLSSVLSRLPQMDAAKAEAIINYRDSLSDKKFKSIDEVLSVSAMDRATYLAIKDFITICGYHDNNCSYRSAVNINTASLEVLKALLWEISDGLEVITESEAESIAQLIINDRPFQGAYKWKDFLSTLDSAVSAGILNADETQLIRNNFDPNREKPSIFTTEFCFNSGGYYILDSSGIYSDYASNQKAKRNIRAIVKLFEMRNETTKEDFKKPWLNDSILHGDGIIGDQNDGEIVKVTYFDSCPVRSDEDYQGAYTAIANSLKSGFWDNFEEDIEFTNEEWNIISGNWHIEDGMMNSSGSMNYHPKIDLGSTASPRWNWSNHSISVYIDDRITIYDTHQETGWWMFGWPTGLPAYEDIRLAVSRLIFRYNSDSPEGNGNFKVGDCGDLSNSPNPADHTDPGVPPYSSPPADREEAYVHGWLPNMDFIDDASVDYNLQKTLKICLENGPSGLSRWYLYVDDADLGDGICYNLPAEGICRIYGYYHQPAFDNVRIIPDTGFYISAPVSAPEEVTWGAIDASVTIADTADINSETIDFQISSDGGASWQTVAVNSSMNTPDSSSIQYKATFETNDKYSSGAGAVKPYFGETAVLEDVWLTYIVDTQILYWSSCYE